MRLLPVVTFCRTKPELIEQIDRIYRELAEFYQELPADRMLVSGEPQGWTVRTNIRHITAVTRLAARYIGLPSWFIALFGKPESDARKPEEVLEEITVTNRPHMTDYGSYGRGKPIDEKTREKDLQALREAGQRLQEAVMKRTEEELDCLRVPFPNRSLRMLAHSVLKHSVYHSSVVRYRMESR